MPNKIIPTLQIVLILSNPEATTGLDTYYGHANIIDFGYNLLVLTHARYNIVNIEHVLPFAPNYNMVGWPIAANYFNAVMALFNLL